MKDERFWKLVALTALGLLAVAVFRNPSGRPGVAGSLFVAPAQAEVAISGAYAYTTSEDGQILYIWDLNTGRDPVVRWMGTAN